MASKCNVMGLAPSRRPLRSMTHRLPRISSRDSASFKQLTPRREPRQPTHETAPVAARDCLCQRLGLRHLAILVPNVADLLSVDRPHSQRVILERNEESF